MAEFPKDEQFPLNRRRGANTRCMVGSGGMREMHPINESQTGAVDNYNKYMMKSKLKLKNGKHDEAIVNYRKALEYEIIALGSDNPIVASTHLRLGLLCLKCSEPQVALDELQIALQVIKQNDQSPKELLWQCHDYLAQAYARFSDTNMEIEHYEKAIEFASDATPHPPELAYMHNNVANAYEKLGKLENTRFHLEEAKSVMKSLKIHKSKEMIKVLLTLGHVYKKHGKTQLAIEQLEESIRISSMRFPGAKHEIRRNSARRTLVDLYKAIKNTTKAEEHERKLNAAWDERPGVVLSEEHETGSPHISEGINDTQETSNHSGHISIRQDYPEYLPYSNISSISSLSLSLLSRNHSSISTSQSDFSVSELESLICQTKPEARDSSFTKPGTLQLPLSTPNLKADDRKKVLLTSERERLTSTVTPDVRNSPEPVRDSQSQAQLPVNNQRSQNNQMDERGLAHQEGQEMRNENRVSGGRFLYNDEEHSRNSSVRSATGNQQNPLPVQNTADGSGLTWSGRSYAEGTTLDSGGVGAEHGHTSMQHHQPLLSHQSREAGIIRPPDISYDNLEPRYAQALDVLEGLLPNTEGPSLPEAQFNVISAHLRNLAAIFQNNRPLANLLEDFSRTVDQEAAETDFEDLTNLGSL